MKKLEPTVYAQDSDLLKAVESGKLALGWTDYEALRNLMKPGTSLSASSFAEGDAGNLLLVSGAAIRKGTALKREALRALRFLTSEWAQSYLSERGYEYPSRGGIVEGDRFGFAASFRPRFVDPQAAVDFIPTRAMLERLALP